MSVRTRLHRHRLDIELAAGADPNTDPLRSERARELIAQETRRRIAANLEQTLAEAEASPCPLSPKAPIARTAIRESHWDVEDVVNRLAGPGPVSPQGVAKVRLLLTDGASPLYGGRTTPAQLRWSLADTVDAFDHGPAMVG